MKKELDLNDTLRVLQKDARGKGTLSSGYSALVRNVNSFERKNEEEGGRACSRLSKMLLRPVIIRWREVDECECWDDADDLRLVIVDVESGVEYSPMVGKETEMRRAVRAHLFVSDHGGLTLIEIEREFIEIARIAMRSARAFPWLEVSPRKMARLRAVR